MFKFVSFAIIALARFGISSASPALANAAVVVPATAGFTGFNMPQCPPGSVYYLFSSDNTAVTVTFSQYWAEAGARIAISANRKNCQLTLGVKIPSGFNIGIANVDYRGCYQLDSKVTAAQQSIYYFQGQVAQATARSNLVGPVTGVDYTYRNTFDRYSTAHSPCGSACVLNIQSALRVSNSANTTGSGYIAMDSIDIFLNQIFNFH